MQRGTWSMFGTALQGKSFPVVDLKWIEAYLLANSFLNSAG